MSPFSFLRERLYGSLADYRPKHRSRRRNFTLPRNPDGVPLQRVRVTRTCKAPILATEDVDFSDARQYSYSTQRNLSPAPYQPARGERYIYPPDEAHLRIPVTWRGFARDKADEIAAIPAGSYVDLHEALGEGCEVEIFVKMRDGRLADLDCFRDVRDLEEGVALVVMPHRWANRGGGRFQG